MDKRRPCDECERRAEYGGEREQPCIFGGRLTFDARHRRPICAGTPLASAMAITASRRRSPSQHDVPHGAIVDADDDVAGGMPGRDGVVRFAEADPEIADDGEHPDARREDSGHELARAVEAPGIEAVPHPAVLRRAVDHGDVARLGLDGGVGESSLDEWFQDGRERRVGGGAIESRAQMRAQVEHRRPVCVRAGGAGEQCALETVEARSRRRTRREDARERSRRAEANGGPRRTTPSASTAARAAAAAMSAIVSTLACARSRMPPRWGRGP